MLSSQNPLTTSDSLPSISKFSVYNALSLPRALPPLSTRPHIFAYSVHIPHHLLRKHVYIFTASLSGHSSSCGKGLFFADCVTVASSSSLLDQLQQGPLLLVSLSLFRSPPPVLLCSSPASDRVVRLSFFRPRRSQTSLKPLCGPLASKPRNTPRVCVGIPLLFLSDGESLQLTCFVRACLCSRDDKGDETESTKAFTECLWLTSLLHFSFTLASPLSLLRAILAFIALLLRTASFRTVAQSTHPKGHRLELTSTIVSKQRSIAAFNRHHRSDLASLWCIWPFY